MGLQQHIFTPTHSENVLDLVLTDITGLISDVFLECPIGNSDHNTVHFSVNIEHNDITNYADILYYNYKDADYDSLNYYMSCINWDYEFSFQCLPLQHERRSNNTRVETMKPLR